jgi:hypothetical protein
MFVDNLRCIICPWLLKWPLSLLIQSFIREQIWKYLIIAFSSSKILQFYSWNDSNIIYKIITTISSLYRDLCQVFLCEWSRCYNTYLIFKMIIKICMVCWWWNILVLWVIEFTLCDKLTVIILIIFAC